MNYFRWLLITTLTVVAVVCLQLVVCYEMDIYGLFRDPHGREIAVSDVDSDRVMKFLLNQRYVPSNFDGLVIGASNTINYRLTAVQSYRLYNESLEGSNASEERILVEQALHRGHFKIAIVCLYPSITSTHSFRGLLDHMTRNAALGSVDSLSQEVRIALHLHSDENALYPDGSHDLAAPKVKIRNTIDFDLDPQALADYRALVQELLAHNIKVVYMVSPLSTNIMEDNRARLDAFLAMIQANLPSAPLIDFNGPEYASFRDDETNFNDGVHLSSKGAEEISNLLNQKLHVALGSPQSPTVHVSEN